MSVARSVAVAAVVTVVMGMGLCPVGLAAASSGAAVSRPAGTSWRRIAVQRVAGDPKRSLALPGSADRCRARVAGQP